MMAYHANIEGDFDKARETADLIYKLVEGKQVKMNTEHRSFFLLQVGTCYMMAVRGDDKSGSMMYGKFKNIISVACKYFNQALQLAPNDNPLTYAYLARCYIELGKLDDAKRVMRLCMTNPSDNMEAEKWQECVILWAFLMTTEGSEEG